MESFNQIGLWREGFVSDAEIITALINELNLLPERRYIKSLTIRRSPPDFDAVHTASSTGFTSIKATVSKEYYL